MVAGGGKMEIPVFRTRRLSPMHHRMIPIAALALIFAFATSGKKPPKKDDRPPDPLDGLTRVTPNFIREHKLSVTDLKGLQYYSGNLITLYRAVTAADQRVASGRLVMTSGRTYEVVVIK